MRKRGEMTLSFIIFLVLTTIFLVMLFYFVYVSSSGAFIYEQIYAKKIALAIDSASPGMEVFLDVADGLKVAEKNKVAPGFSVDNEKGMVLVNLGSKKKFSENFFSSYVASIDLIKKNKIL